MRLVHEVPDVDRAVGFADEADACPAGTPAAGSVEAAFGHRTAENGRLRYHKVTLMLFFQMLKWKS